MLTEQDLIRDKWKLFTPNRYTKLGVILSKRYDGWECHYTVGTVNIWTMSENYRTLQELYEHIKHTVKIILSPKHNYLHNLTTKQKRTLKNWIL